MKITDVPHTGKLGLTVTYPGRNGLIRRTKVSPKNPQTGAQVQQRSILTQSAQAFDALTEAQQNTWNSAAAKYKSRPTLGQSGPLTGLQLFVKVNASNLTVGAPLVDVPPAVPAPVALNITGLTATLAAGVVTLKLTTTDAPPDGTMLWGCAPENSGVRRAMSPRYLGICGNPANGAVDITAQYTAKFGAPTKGSRIFVQANTNQNGWEGLRQTFSALVPAN